MQYTRDDIRLCTMKPSTENESLGIRIRYHRHESFFYVTFDDRQEQMNTLAYRAGLRPYDRVIEHNGVNIEKLSSTEFQRRWDTRRKETTQLLVCSPATYLHYKQLNQSITRKFLTVMLITPSLDLPDKPTDNTWISSTSLINSTRSYFSLSQVIRKRDPF